MDNAPLIRSAQSLGLNFLPPWVVPSIMIFFTFVALVTCMALKMGGARYLYHSDVNYIVEVIKTVYESIKYNMYYSQILLIVSGFPE